MSSTSTCVTTASATASSAAAPQLSPSNNNNSFLANNSHSITDLTSPTPPGAGGLGRISDPMLSNATGSNSPLGSTALGPSSSIHADLLEAKKKQLQISSDSGVGSSSGVATGSPPGNSGGSAASSSPGRSSSSLAGANPSSNIGAPSSSPLT